MMKYSIWRIIIIIMEIIKLLKDYPKTKKQKSLSTYLIQELDTQICREKIKNKKFMIRYIQPLNDFIIHTTALPCCNVRRMF